MAKNLYASLFGDSPAAQQARETRNASFQDMLSSRRQAAEQARTDNAQMARYNALGNVLTTMVQPLGWAVGGSTGNVQQYDNRQYLDAFNRAVKASDDLRNIGTLEDDYRFKLAEQDYNRLQSLEDSERQQQRMIERQELAEQGRIERDQKKYEQQMELQQQKDDARMQLEQYRQTHRVSKKGTGLSVSDKLLLEEIRAYNQYVNNQSKVGKPFDNFDQWMDKKGYKVDNVRTANPGGLSSSSTSSSPASGKTSSGSGNRAHASL